MKAIRVLLVAIITLSVIDAASTWIALDLGYQEGNPFARGFIDQVGVAPAMVSRVLIGLFVAWGCVLCLKHRPTRDGRIVITTFLVLVSLFWLVVCTNNLIKIGQVPA